jgi:hypothetical protein
MIKNSYTTLNRKQNNYKLLDTPVYSLQGLCPT